MDAVGSNYPSFTASVVNGYVRSVVRKSFLRGRYVMQGDLKFKVGLPSFIDGGVIGHLLRGEPNILRVVLTGDLNPPEIIPVETLSVETLSNITANSLLPMATDAVEPVKTTYAHIPAFSTLYIAPQVISEIGDLAGAYAARDPFRNRSVEEINLALRDTYNSERINMGVVEMWGIHECVRGVAVGYHEPDIFEKCWSASFMSGKPDIAEFPGGWSVSVPTDWDGLNLDQRSRVIAADIISWAEETTPPRMPYSDLAKLQLLT